MSVKTASFYTQGCRLNQSETALLEQQFENFGYSVVPFEQAADVVVINTCTVTENGDADAKRLVSKIHQQHPSSGVALIGCMAQIQKDHLLKWPGVRWVVGNAHKMDLPALIESNDSMVLAPKMTKESFTLPPTTEDRHHTRANLKVQDGCDFYCAFCVIPFARGPARSREYDDILKDATSLVNSGHREIVITGVNIGTYADQDYRFLDIIKGLESIDGLDRIRISSIEPTTIPNELIEHMAVSLKLCRHLHIPIQSATDEVLTLMSRKYSMTEFNDFIEFAHETVPDLCIGTDVIVGFPGETDDLFDQTETYLRESCIDYFHVFSYSERAFARSQKMDGQVSSHVISERSRILRELSARKRDLFYRSQLGQKIPVLIESKKQGRWTGLTDHYVRVQFDSDDQELKNQVRQVKLLSINGNYVEGSLD